MKKKRMLAAALALTLALSLTACNLNGGGDSASASGETGFITNVLVESGTANNGGTGKVEYSYTVPHLNLETPGAASINERIDREIGSYVQKQLEAASTDGLSLKTVSWKDFWSGDLLSLVIKAEYSDSSLSYYVYNYDQKNDAVLDNAALLARALKDPVDFENRLRRAVAREFDLQATKLEEDAFDAVQLMRMDAISSANLSLDHIRVFVEDGKLRAVVNMPTPAAGGSDSKVVTPEFTPEEEPVSKTVERGFVTAKLENDTVTLTFKQTETSDRYMHAVVEYDKAYPVEGLYNHYTDIALGVLGQDFIPYLFLTDENGQVTFCNIMGCMNAGSRFVAAGPVRLPEQVASYEDHPMEEGNTMLAVLQSGKKVDLADYTTSVESCIMLPMNVSSWSSAEDEKYWMDIQTGGDYPMVWGEMGSESLSNGWIAYAGMTEKGGVYRFVGRTPDGSKTGGYLTLARDSFNVDGHGEFWMEVNVASGSALPGVAVGSTLKMTRSYG